MAVALGSQYTGTSHGRPAPGREADVRLVAEAQKGDDRALAQSNRPSIRHPFLHARDARKLPTLEAESAA